jgi:hypothetical protein
LRDPKGSLFFYLLTPLLRYVKINITNLHGDFMIGNLEPEENVMDDTPTPWLGQLAQVLQELNWDPMDKISVDVGGVAVTGTATHPEANPKWAKPFGTVSYQNDAFIVIKNLSRNHVVSSQPNPDLKQHHSYTKN